MCRCWKKHRLSILVGGLEPWNFMIFHSVGNFRKSQLTIRPWFFRAQPPTSITTVKKTAWSSESHLYGWWNHLWAATWLTWRKMKHDNPKKTAQNQSGTKGFGKITPQAVRWQKLNPHARPKSAKLHGCRASCHGTGVAVRNCHSISDLPSKCPQVLIWVCLKVGKPVISWLK